MPKIVTVEQMHMLESEAPKVLWLLRVLETMEETDLLLPGY